MATIREGNKEALVIVDVQVGVMQNAWDADRIIRSNSRLRKRKTSQSKGQLQ